MNQSKVAIIYCDNYEKEKVYQALKEGLSVIGDLHQFVKTEEKILVKPNFLYTSDPDKAIITHPAVIEGLLRILNEEGYHQVKVGDSNANGTSLEALKKAGLNKEELHGALPAAMNEEAIFEFPQGKVCRKFIFTKDVTEADAIIGVSKMKTHMLERITGAVKNMYGLICGGHKRLGHIRYNTPIKFARMLSDIHNATPQRLHIMDGVVAMEGNGPGSGEPIKMNVILMSSDPIAIDTVFARLVYLNPQLVPTIRIGYEYGLGNKDFRDIELTLIDSDGTNVISIDELVKKYGNPNFDVTREKEKLNVLTFWSRLNGGAARPVIDPNKCVKCGICVNHCPVEGKAVDFRNGRNNPPVYDYKKCIRCYCCQELCPQKAISVKR